MLMIPLSLLLVAGAGMAICNVAGMEFQLRAMILAGVICLAADELATVPLLLVRGGDQLAVSQAALAGTMAQMMATLLGSGGVMMMQSHASGAFVYWVLAFYLTSLVVLVTAFVVVLKKAPIATQTPSHKD